MPIFKKKSSADEDDSARSSLFGSRKQKADSSSSNPYAQQGKADPYASAPPPYNGGNNSSGSMDAYRRDKSPAVTGQGGSYGGSSGGGGGYSAFSGGYGANSGYGEQQPYGGGASQAGRSRYGASGYGGFGEGNDDADRGALFGGAKDRYQQRQDQPPQAAGGNSTTAAADGYGASGAYGAGASAGNYGAYQDRQLTAEEQEEEDVQAAKNEIKFLKQQDVASTRNALRIAQQAEETGRDTLSRLAAQGERIHNTERNLDLASNQNRIAQEKARELKTLNRSMFAVHVSNPFTSKSRADARDEKIMETHRQERDQRDATRSAAFSSQARQQEYAQNMKGGANVGRNKTSLADRAKYQFEADSDDEAMENEIDSNLDALHGAAQRLNGLSLAMGREVDEQNKHLGRIIKKADDVDDQIAMNRARLDRIH